MRALLIALMLCFAIAPAAAAADGEAGVQVRKPKLMVVPESVVNGSAAQQYVQMKEQAAARGLRAGALSAEAGFAVTEGRVATGQCSGASCRHEDGLPPHRPGNCRGRPQPDRGRPRAPSLCSPP